MKLTGTWWIEMPRWRLIWLAFRNPGAVPVPAQYIRPGGDARVDLPPEPAAGWTRPHP